MIFSVNIFKAEREGSIAIVNETASFSTLDDAL
jgi:hypothetical protein